MINSTAGVKHRTQTWVAIGEPPHLVLEKEAKNIPKEILCENKSEVDKSYSSRKEFQVGLSYVREAALYCGIVNH